ncbi:hypothetical protein C8R44DRAFT_819272 [Mycena epipterygia]|nr:hypothetical protein C8R44DRAFT_819272 [Mycena epipterygia]
MPFVLAFEVSFEVCRCAILVLGERRPSPASVIVTTRSMCPRGRSAALQQTVHPHPPRAIGLYPHLLPLSALTTNRVSAIPMVASPSSTR